MVREAIGQSDLELLKMVRITYLLEGFLPLIVHRDKRSLLHIAVMLDIISSHGEQVNSMHNLPDACFMYMHRI